MVGQVSGHLDNKWAVWLLILLFREVQMAALSLPQASFAYTCRAVFYWLDFPWRTAANACGGAPGKDSGVGPLHCHLRLSPEELLVPSQHQGKGFSLLQCISGHGAPPNLHTN